MRKRRRRPNWPYRFALLVIAGLTLLYASVQAIIGAYTFESIFYQIDWTTAIISSLLDTTVAFWFVCVGASIGSFLNVVAYRLPIGRNVGGHSSCPYCRLQIDSGDNIPILGWLKIRGRCRSCRLPISIQYPLVELAVGLVFLAVYLSEFFFGGWNLPGEAGIPFSAGGLARISISVPLAVRLATYLFALGGLIGAALIAVRKQKVPFKLYFWCLVPLGISVLCAPDFIILRWRDALPAGGVEMRLDALVNMLCGSVAGIAMARLLAPLLYPGF
ncbi:MAG: prepilin peptidase, partial [Planctomycetota bacterium]